MKNTKETTALQERATRENFAVYMLYGWRRFIKSKYIEPVMSRVGHAKLLNAIDAAIGDIQVKQAKRIEQQRRTPLSRREEGRT